MTKKNRIRVIKDVFFNAIPQLEDIFAYNRKRRDKWIMKNAKSIPDGSMVLDVGAGSCPHKKLFSHCKYYAHDFAELSDEQIQTQDGYGQLDYVSDILDIPVLDSSFDVILCTEVIEHVPDPISTIKEISRILKPGGALLLTAPLQSGLHQEPYHFYGGYTKYWYKKYLSENDFSNIKVEANGSLHTTYFSLGSTIFKGFLEQLFSDSIIIKKALALASIIIFAPIFLFINPLFCFLWEYLYKEQAFTAGYHVFATKKKISD